MGTLPGKQNVTIAIAAAIGTLAAVAAITANPWVWCAVAGLLLTVPLMWWLIGTANRWVAGFLAAALLLPPLPIALGNTGPHPALLFAAAGGWVGVLRLREWNLKLNSVAVAMLVLLAILMASLAPAVVYSGGAMTAGSLARIALFAISVYVYLFMTQGPGTAARFNALRAARWLLLAGLLVSTFACLDFYYQFPAPAGYGAQFVWLDVGVLRRAQGLFYEASTLGNCCAFFLVLVAVLAATGARISKWALAITGGVLSAALLFSYSRASIVALVCALTALVYVRGGFTRWRRWLVPLPLMLGAGALLVYLVFPEFAQSYLIRARASFQFFFDDPNRILSGRLQTWRAVIELLADHPLYLLCGIGYKTLPYSDLGSGPLVADNMYLSMLIETGIPGLLAFLWLNLQIMLSAYRARSTLFGTWMFCFWIGELVQMLSGDLFTYWRVLPLYFWTLACAGRGGMDERPLR